MCWWHEYFSISDRQYTGSSTSSDFQWAVYQPIAIFFWFPGDIPGCLTVYSPAAVLPFLPTASGDFDWLFLFCFVLFSPIGRFWKDVYRILSSNNGFTSLSPSSIAAVAQRGNNSTSLLSHTVSKNNWIADAGASDHMTESSNVFVSYETCADDMNISVLMVRISMCLFWQS